MKLALSILLITFNCAYTLTLSNSANAEEPTKAELEAHYTDLKKQMNEHMELMHQQMDEIKKTKNPVKKTQLMREHERSMHDSMKLMKQMGAKRMLDENKEPGYRMTVDERLDYMESMMEQMMHHLSIQNAYME